jgi:hypothetical protein
MAPTCFGLRVYCVLCGAQHPIHTPYWDMLPHHRITNYDVTLLRRNLNECFNINVTLARLNCKLPDDGRIPKHVGAI